MSKNIANKCLFTFSLSRLTSGLWVTLTSSRQLSAVRSAKSQMAMVESGHKGEEKIKGRQLNSQSYQSNIDRSPFKQRDAEVIILSNSYSAVRVHNNSAPDPECSGI